MFFLLLFECSILLWRLLFGTVILVGSGTGVVRYETTSGALDLPPLYRVEILGFTLWVNPFAAPQVDPDLDIFSFMIAVEDVAFVLGKLDHDVLRVLL